MESLIEEELEGRWLNQGTHAKWDLKFVPFADFYKYTLIWEGVKAIGCSGELFPPEQTEDL